jgi:hypothetical protein
MYLANRVDRWLWEPLREWKRKQQWKVANEAYRSSYDSYAILWKDKRAPNTTLGIGHIREPFHESIRKVLAAGGRFFQPSGAASRSSFNMPLLDCRGNRVGGFSLNSCRAWAKHGFLVEEVRPGVGRAFYLASKATA